MTQVAPVILDDTTEDPCSAYQPPDTAIARRLYKEVWSRLPQKNKSLLSMPQNVLLLSTSDEHSHKYLVNGKVVFLPSMPSVLYWIDDSRTDFQYKIDVLETYYAQMYKKDLGIKVGEAALAVLVQRTRLAGRVEASQVVVFKLETQELIVLLPTQVSHMWKKSLSALVRSFLQSHQKFQDYNVPIASPRDPGPLDHSFSFDTQKSPLLGQIYDISASNTPEESKFHLVWINIKLTCITTAGQTNEEYLVYDKNQEDLSQSTNDLAASVSERLDSTNDLVFRHFLEELQLLETEKRGKKTSRLGRTNNYQEEVFSSYQLSLSEFLVNESGYNWCAQFDKIYRNYLEYDSMAIRRSWNITKRKVNDSAHPCHSLFHTMHMTTLSQQLALSGLLSSASGEELLGDIAKLREVTESEQEEVHSVEPLARPRQRTCETCVIS